MFHLILCIVVYLTLYCLYFHLQTYIIHRYYKNKAINIILNLFFIIFLLRYNSDYRIYYDSSIGKDILIIIIFPPNSSLAAILFSPQSLQSDTANSIIYAIPINFIIKDMYIDGIFALSASLFISLL